MANGNKKSGKSHKPCDLYPPHTSTQTPRCVSEKRFPLFSCLSQRKTTLFSEPSTSLRLWVTHVKNVKKLGGHLIRFRDMMFKRSPSQRICKVSVETKSSEFRG